MAVRQFDGVDDDIRHAVGSALADMDYGTVALLFKPQPPFGDWHAPLTIAYDDRSTSGNFYIYEDGNDAYFGVYSERAGDGDEIQLGPFNRWYLVVVYKGPNVNPARISVYDYVTGQWTHEDTKNFWEWWAVGSDGIIQRSDTDAADDGHFRGLLAVQAMWSNRDAFGSTEDVEAAGLEESLQAWFDAEPDALWAFNQASVTDPVDDLVGDAHQITRVGTAVVTNDDPPGFDWGDGDEPAIIGSGEATLPAVAGSGSGAALIDGSGQATLPAYAGDGAGAALIDGSGQAALPGIVAEGVGAVADTDITEILWDGTPVTWDGQQARWGESTAIDGSGEATLPPLTAQGAGAALVDGSGEATIPPLTAEGAGAPLTEGSGQAVLPAYAGEGAGAALVEGVGESALPAIAASGDGTVYSPEIFGSGEATFAAFVADGVGDVLVIGFGEATVPALVAAGRGFQGDPPEHRAGSEQTVLRRRGFSTTALRS